MNPTILGAIGPGFLNQVPTLGPLVAVRAALGGPWVVISMVIRLMDKILHDP